MKIDLCNALDIYFYALLYTPLPTALERLKKLKQDRCGEYTVTYTKYICIYKFTNELSIDMNGVWIKGSTGGWMRRMKCQPVDCSSEQIFRFTIHCLRTVCFFYRAKSK